MDHPVSSLGPKLAISVDFSRDRGLWDVRYTAIHSWVGTIGILVEGGWSGRWSDGRRSGGMSPLIG